MKAQKIFSKFDENILTFPLDSDKIMELSAKFAKSTGLTRSKNFVNFQEPYKIVG